VLLAADRGEGVAFEVETENRDAVHSASSIHAIWIASRIFSPQRFGSSLNPGSAITHW
jgi:hypothetical protein